MVHPQVMSRRVTAQLGLAALGLAVVLVIALTTDWSRTSEATAPESTAPATSAAPTAKARPTKAQRQAARRSAAVQKLLDGHGCWMGQAPDGVAPTHAVVTLPGSEPALVAADVGFGIWLEGDPGVLHGFCP